MSFSLASLMSYPIWTLVFAIFFPALAAIATFVCLRRANSARRLIGFFVIVPIYVALAVVVCGDTGGLVSTLLPCLRTYPGIGTLAAICFGIICLNFIGLICGAGILKRRGAIVNTVASIIAFFLNSFITYSAWAFGDYIHSNGLFRYDMHVISVKDAFPYLEELGFIPSVIIDSGVEILSLAVLALFIIVYFLSFIPQKSAEEILKEDLERKRRAALAASVEKRDSIDKIAHTCADEDECTQCCEFCEHATPLKSDRTKMVCDRFGVVSATHKCRKFLYDPLKRKAFRPKIDTEDQLEHIDI
ncbi:MAG: hypothetical protein II319_00355 [Clostridia bacterium]|nr:hypothetical protein [Clostridia bacterium]